MSGREQYDERIPAKNLQRGDQIHLTVMGGDEYEEVVSVRAAVGGIRVTMYGWGGEHTDLLTPNFKVWIKKRDRS